MSRRVRVAMLDSGVYTGNAHIQRGLEGGVSILPDGVERPEFQDTLGHGTAVCAVLQQMAPEADLYSVKIFDKRLATSLPIVLRAIDWCLKQEIDIINLSLGTANEEHRPLFLAAIDRVQKSGALLVSAYAVTGTLMLPGALPRVVGVVEDATCPRETYRVICEGTTRFAACPFPLDIAGVPRERNIHGVSFAVAHISSQIAKRWHEPSPETDWVARLAESVPTLSEGA